MPGLRPFEPQRYKQAAVRFARRMVGKKTPPQSVDLTSGGGTAVSVARPSEILQDLTSEEFFYLLEEDKRLLRLIVADSADSVLDAVIRAADRKGLRCVGHNGINGERIFSVPQAKDVLGNSRIVEFVISPNSARSDSIVVRMELWSLDENGHFQGIRNNRWVSKIWAGNSLLEERPIGGVDLRDGLPGPTTEDPTFDVDYVFSWVNSDDEDWKKLYSQYRPTVETDATSESRFVARNDLKFALRALEKNAPWVRNIFVITNCAPPEWLDTEASGITWTDHSEVFPPDALPTFSSHAIETTLHKIPGLSEHFIYSNDDFFLTRPTGKQDFFFSTGMARTRLESYGMVNGPVQTGQPDYLNSARNSAELLKKKFGVYPTRLHTHSPQSLRKSILEEMEAEFPEDFARTRRNRFRADDDIAAAGFFHAHYSHLSGRSVPVGTPTRLIQQNHNFEAIFKNIANQLAESGRTRHLSVCVNDGNDSHLNEDWNRATAEFLETMFPRKSRFER